MSRISTPDAHAQTRPEAPQPSERLAWFVAAFVLVAVFVSTIAGDLRGSSLVTPPQSGLTTPAGGKLAAAAAVDVRSSSLVGGL